MRVDIVLCHFAHLFIGQIGGNFVTLQLLSTFAVVAVDFRRCHAISIYQFWVDNKFLQLSIKLVDMPLMQTKVEVISRL